MTSLREERVTQAAVQAASALWKPVKRPSLETHLEVFASFEVEARHAATTPLLDLIEKADDILASALAGKTIHREQVKSARAALTAALAQHRTNGDG